MLSKIHCSLLTSFFFARSECGSHVSSVGWSHGHSPKVPLPTACTTTTGAGGREFGRCAAGAVLGTRGCAAQGCLWRVLQPPPWRCRYLQVLPRPRPALSGVCQALSSNVQLYKLNITLNFSAECLCQKVLWYSQLAPEILSKQQKFYVCLNLK